MNRWRQFFQHLFRVRIAINVALVAAAITGLGMWLAPPAMEKIVRSVLLENPEIVLEAVELLRYQEHSERSERQLVALAQHGDVLRKDPNAPFAGNPNGDVIVVEFYDYKCQYCRQFISQLEELLAVDGSIKFVFRELPILGTESVTAARASLAAANQGTGLFLSFHSALMQTQGYFDDTLILQVAAEAGLDVDLLAIDMLDPEIDRQLEKNFELAAELNISGTPGFIIGDVIVPGYVDAGEIQRLVSNARDDCQTC